jgi:multidrug/hemolysin transport system permease protein
MRPTLALIKRHMINYFYDKTSIFFSMLSVFLLVLVYILFLGQLQSSNIKDLIGDQVGIDGSVVSWLLAGLILTSTVTVTMSTMSDMVTDKENHMFEDFFVAPIKRSAIVVSYIVSAMIIGTLMASLTLLLGFLYLGIVESYWYSLTTLMSAFGVIIVSVAIFSAMSYFIVSFIKTTSAAGTVNTLIGTLIGFFAGIYVPVGAFSPSFQNIMSLNPAAQLASLLRQILTQPFNDMLFDGAPIQYYEDYQAAYGITLKVFEVTLQSYEIVVIGALWVMIFMFLGMFRLRKFKG